MAMSGRLMRPGKDSLALRTSKAAVLSYSLAMATHSKGASLPMVICPRFSISATR